jgi:hypothetical protein
MVATIQTRPHPEERRGRVSKDGGGRILRDALLRNAPQDEADRAINSTSLEWKGRVSCPS